jgi:aspartate dehydrogenase
MRSSTVGVIGFGAIGSVLASALLEQNDASLAGVLVRPANADAARAALPESVPVVTGLLQLLMLRPGVIVECAGQQAVRDHAEEILRHGTDLMIVSTGALAEPDFLDRVSQAARQSGARLLIPAGAIAGLDGLGSLKCAGLSSVTYTSSKPPQAWRGTPAERVLDLAHLRKRSVFFEGTARDAALNYPKNANLAATVALAGLGLDSTIVRLVADPDAAGNTGTLEATSGIGDLRVVMSGPASANPKTSASTAYSLLHALRNRDATIVI